MKKIVFLLFLFSFLNAQVFSPQGEAQFFLMESPLIGKQVPDFTLPTLNGKEKNLHDLISAEKAIIFFWATWCPHCRRALQELQEQRQKFIQKKIKVVLVDSGEKAQRVRSYLEKEKIGFDTFLDVQSSLSNPYHIIGIPTFFFVDQKGIVRAVKHSLPHKYENLF